MRINTIPIHTIYFYFYCIDINHISAIYIPIMYNIYSCSLSKYIPIPSIYTPICTIYTPISTVYIPIFSIYLNTA